MQVDPDVLVTRFASWSGPWRALRIAEPIFVLILLLAFIGLEPVFLVGESRLPPGVVIEGGGDTLRELLYVSLFLTVVVNSYLGRGTHFLLKVPIGLLVVLAWCWLSVLWAIAPEIALRRIAFTTIVALSLVYTVRHLSYKDTIGILSTILAAIVLLDWISVALFTDAIHQAGPQVKDPTLGGSWRGVHDNKNEAGAFCAVACLIFLHLTVVYRSYIVGPILISLSLGFLYMTSSKTSFGFLFVAIAVGSTAKFGVLRPRVRNAAVVGAALLLLLLFSLDAIPIKLIEGTLDDPAALTGRARIWPVLLNYLSDHPWLGAGYGSFWAIGADSPILTYGSGWLTTINHAHNGYLNLAIQIGLPGAALVIVALVATPLYALFGRPFRGASSRWLICSVLVFCWLRDLLESSFLDRDNTTWIVMVIMYVLLADAIQAEASTSYPNLFFSPAGVAEPSRGT
jgi:exopolysaccharide production protein ExoQ